RRRRALGSDLDLDRAAPRRDPHRPGAAPGAPPVAALAIVLVAAGFEVPGLGGEDGEGARVGPLIEVLRRDVERDRRALAHQERRAAERVGEGDDRAAVVRFAGPEVAPAG